MKDKRSSGAPRRTRLFWELLPLAVLAAAYVYTFMKSSAAPGPAAVSAAANQGLAAKGFSEIYYYANWAAMLYLILSITQLMVSNDRFTYMKFSGFADAKALRLGFIYTATLFAAKTGIMGFFFYIQVLSLDAMSRGAAFKLQRRTAAPGIIVIIAIFLIGLYFLYKEFTAREIPEPEDDRPDME